VVAIAVEAIAAAAAIVVAAGGTVLRARDLRGHSGGRYTTRRDRPTSTSLCDPCRYPSRSSVT